MEQKTNFVAGRVRRILLSRALLALLFGVIAGFMLIAIAGSISGQAGTAVLTWGGVILLVLLVLYFISRFVMMGAPDHTRVYRRLVKKGSATPASDLAAKIDEAAANGTLKKVGKMLYFCPEAMAFFAANMGQLHPSGDLVWIYPHVVRRRAYGVPVGSNWSVVLCFADRRQANATVRNEVQAKELVQQLLGVCPGVLSGYSSDRAAKFKTGHIDDLRAEMQHRPPQTTPPVPTGPTAQAPSYDPALLSGAGTPPGAAVASDTPYEQRRNYYGRGSVLTSKTDKETRRDMKALKKQAKEQGQPEQPGQGQQGGAKGRGELDTRDVSAPPIDMQASAPKEATAPPEETSFGLSDDDFNSDFK